MNTLCTRYTYQGQSSISQSPSMCTGNVPCHNHTTPCGAKITGAVTTRSPVKDKCLDLLSWHLCNPIPTEMLYTRQALSAACGGEKW